MERINGHVLEYFDESHTYIVDGIEVPSITQILKYKFGRKYEGISKDVLKNAADAGTRVHNAIEDWCKNGTESDLPEVRNFKFLQKRYGFKVLENEVPVVLEMDGKVVAAGRLDLVLEMDGKVGGGDIKRTYTLDKEYLAYQLNLYRIAYRQSYGVTWEFLKGVHLRNDTRKFVDIPIREPQIWEFLREWEAQNEDTREMDTATVSPFKRKKVHSDAGTRQDAEDLREDSGQGSDDHN